ncbi:MAG: peptidoglycan DD-metalloendopeptidase family protein [Candidatus Omnitrophica bacterium]|nr:peptidoglycan DD-metalloendopeptidase family protein [Candidatus Omnitrophota bacterium]
MFVIICSLTFLSGCATTAPYIPPAPSKPPSDLTGTYHRVEKGETLWRISKRYGADLEELTRINRITDNTFIEVGQKIFIPDKLKDEVKVLKYAASDDFIWPLKGRVVSFNKGIKISPYSPQDILASRSGKVVFLGKNFTGLNRAVILDHGDGFFTIYGLSSDVFVKPGESVKRGAVIGRITGSGKDNCLHFEVRKGHLPQNPYHYLP